jgi:ribulose-5-phosphate 4-epimerase/fuculose-1-phosphate aldolase
MSELELLFEDLVDANHILYRQGIVDGYGHASFRHPSRPEHFFMAAAVSPGRVRDTDIIELDLDGKIVSGEERPTYSERFIHAEVYRARGDVNAVIHSHSPTVIPFSVTDVPLRPIIHSASFMHTGVPVFNTHQVPEATTPLVNSPVIGKALVATLGQNSIVLMRGHGNTVVGPELREAVSRAIYAEVNARLLLQALSLGRPIIYMNSDEAKAMQGGGVNPGRGSSHGVDRVWQMWVDEIRK